MAFDGRLIRLAQRAVEDCLTHNHSAEVETPYWGAIVTNMQEVVFTHNFGFRPTGMMREAYIAHLNAIYARIRRRRQPGNIVLQKHPLIEISQVPTASVWR